VVDINELAHTLLGLGPDALGRPFAQVCGVLAPSGADLAMLSGGCAAIGSGAQQNVEMYSPVGRASRGTGAQYLPGGDHLPGACRGRATRVALLCRDVSGKRRLEDEIRARPAAGGAGPAGLWRGARFRQLVGDHSRGGRTHGRARHAGGGDEGEHLDTILRVVEDATSLSRQLLAFSRGETVKPEILHLNVLIQRAIRRMLAPSPGR
jgi:hypothetical protein